LLINEYIKNIEKKLDEMKTTNTQLLASNKSLLMEIGSSHQELYEMSEHVSDVNGEFITLAELRGKYTYMGKQKLVEFILEFKKLFQRSDLTTHLASLTQLLREEVNSQHLSFCPSLRSISNKSKLCLEINTYLQNNFKTTMKRYSNRR
jgi:hypothetical protein